MNSFAIHPALIKLIRLRAVGGLRSLKSGFSSPRRTALTLLALAMAVLWLGNAALSVVLRDAYDPEAFRQWSAVAFTIYFLWHLVRLAFKRPEAAVNWTPAERELLCAGPFSRRELLTYRYLVILTATLPKAVLATLLLIPDLPLPVLGFCGILGGLLLIDYLRVLLETIVVNLSRRGYAIARGMVLVAVCAVTGWCLLHAIAGATSGASTGWILVLKQAWQHFLTLLATPVGEIVQAPFAIVGRVLTAETLSLAVLRDAAILTGMLFASAHVAMRVDERFGRQGDSEGDHDPDRADTESPTENHSLPAVPNLHGVGLVAWRQWKEARRYPVSLIVAMLAPALLSLAPLSSANGPQSALLSVLGSAFFYSLVLLPAAFKFDFRRDFDRLPLLKSLPIPNLPLVVGQILVPVALVTAFQWGVVLIAGAIHPLPWASALTMLLILVPVNVFCVALDNIIFVLYPHRLHQEGFTVFLRTTLTFTGKGLLFGLVFVAVTSWAIAAARVSTAYPSLGSSREIFLGGLAVAGVLLAALGVWGLRRAFAGWSPAQ